MNNIDYAIYSSKEIQSSTQAIYTDGPCNFTIVDRKYITPTVFILILKDNNNTPFTGVELGGHLRFFIPPAPRSVENQWNGANDIESRELIKRVYTPIFVDPQNKLLHFAIRVYEPCEEFCDGGKCSRSLANLPLNSEVSCQVVPGKLHYKTPSQFAFQSSIFTVKKVAFIAGGTGITLFYRIISNIIHNPSDNTEIILLFSVRNIDEIILHQALEQFDSPLLFKKYFITKPAVTADYINSGTIVSGFINKEILTTKVKDCCHTFICGPKPFNKYIHELLIELGVANDRITPI